jgi:hypothetical protein
LLRFGFDANNQAWAHYLSEEGTEYDLILCVAATEDQYQDLVNDRLPLRDFLLNPTSGNAYRLEHSHAGHWAVETLEADQITESFECLPEAGVYLNPKT